MLNSPSDIIFACEITPNDTHYIMKVLEVIISSIEVTKSWLTLLLKPPSFENLLKSAMLRWPLSKDDMWIMTTMTGY